MADARLSRPATRTTTLARPGADSSTTGSRPASVRAPATYSAAARSLQSPPPRLAVSNLIRSDANCVTEDAPSTAWASLMALPCAVITDCGRLQRRIEQSQRLRIGVKLGRYANRERLEVPAVTYVRPGDHRHANVI